MFIDWGRRQACMLLSHCDLEWGLLPHLRCGMCSLLGCFQLGDGWALETGILPEPAVKCRSNNGQLAGWHMAA